MNSKDRWLLPAGISEILPNEADYLEKLRRRLLDLYASWGYELVIPPLVEYLESLLFKRGDALDLQTFKLIDQLTGRLMGVRADMTPQVARIDAHHLKRQAPTRLCYLGTVLHTRPNNFADSRSPQQVGAELYGYEGIAGDVEILSLMLETLRETGISEFKIDIGHVSIYQNLIEQTNLNTPEKEDLFDAMKRKAVAEIQEILSKVSPPLRQMLSELVQLNGDRNILKEARKVLSSAPPEIHAALDDLDALSLSPQFNEISLHFDLAESRGYNYHTGIVFAAYVSKHGQAIAKGGRYDVGYNRPATGFSTNLITLLSILENQLSRKTSTIFAPVQNDTKLAATVQKLRQAGEVVICSLPNQVGDAKTMGCDRELRLMATGWEVVSL
jgi:ATP phosphoribosyltransferase regulatory subunit